MSNKLSLIASYSSPFVKHESGSKKPGFLFALILNFKRHIHFHGYSPSFLIASIKVLDAHTESVCYPWQNRGARHRQTVFPLGNRRLIDANLFGKRVLCHFRFLPQLFYTQFQYFHFLMALLFIAHLLYPLIFKSQYAKLIFFKKMLAAIY